MWFVFIFVFRLLTSTWCQTWVLVNCTIKSLAYYLIWKQTWKFPVVSWVNVSNKPELHQYCITAKITWIIHICMCWPYQTPVLLMMVPTCCQQLTENIQWYLLSIFVPWSFNEIFFNTISPLSITKGTGLPEGPSYKRWIKVFNKDSRPTNICLMVTILWE